ncbi:membrane integrity-associated transporter subunit PqiC [Sinimarinibacterium sp. NLF-5-8]|uniref:PqiC family protein n=1 Tax=Sinimarinibacterium sp. NLF-5-8 TaxID=2698684 RepID=UPI00137C1F7B|nr:PqiC family protein [Sinimarinibacterium sp. NLF-5-8]QHS09689.1 membrane integrity-associated transporter subunit PqiC [Sinimarinibacterium sp. NLF-5-8]
MNFLLLCRRVAVASGAVLLAACASPASTHLYTLVPPLPAGVDDHGARAAYAIEVMPVSVPEQVDMPQIVIRNGIGELQVAETRQWAASLGRELRGALSQRLTRQLGVIDVYRLPGDALQSLWKVRVNVQRFDSTLEGFAVLQASWSLSDSDQALICTSQIRQRVSGGYDALVEGHQRAAIELADTLAAALRRLAAGERPACPEDPA